MYNRAPFGKAISNEVKRVHETYPILTEAIITLGQQTLN